MSLLPETMEVMLQETIEEERNKDKIKEQNAMRVKARNMKNNSNKEKAERVRKVRLYPTKEERQKLNQRLGIYRWIYNQCVDYHRKTKKKPVHQELRDLFVKNSILKESGNE
jgi:hypothetical protein